MFIHLKHCRCSSPPQQVPLVRLHHHLTLNFLHLQNKNRHQFTLSLVTYLVGGKAVQTREILNVSCGS